MSASSHDQQDVSTGQRGDVALFDFEPNLGAREPEPSLRRLVRGYYGPHFAPEKADALTAEYFAALANHPLKVGEREGLREALRRIILDAKMIIGGNPTCEDAEADAQWTAGIARELKARAEAALAAAPTPTEATPSEGAGIVAWLEKQIEAAERDAATHPEGSANRAFYAAQVIAYENALSAVRSTTRAAEDSPTLSFSGNPMPTDWIEGCVYCGEPFKQADMILPEADGGNGHVACMGTDRDGFTGEDGEPLKDGEPIPTGYPWEPLSAPVARPVGEDALREETEDELDERIARQGACENMRLIDSISDLIGLPHNVELELQHVRDALAPPTQQAPDQGDVPYALAYCAEAVAFFDQVKASSGDEQAAVGTDHWNWLEAACRRAALLATPKASTGEA